MDDMTPKLPAIAPLKIPPRDIRDRPSPLSSRPPRPEERGYDPRIDPAVQNPGYGRGKPPPQSPLATTPLPDSPAAQGPGEPVPPAPAPAEVPSPRGTSSPERVEEVRERAPRPPEPGTSQERSQSRPREASVAQPSRGNCRACGLPIKGKSISSADGRLTGRYHKPCFVCSACQQPFSSSTFYVLDDRPYCELHYHKLNGSLCGSCGRGIEGQYLEDESRVKHHVGCFRCGMCHMALRDGYFEVNGRAYCEMDAWTLMQQQQQQHPPPPQQHPPLHQPPPPWAGRGGARPGLGPPGRPPFGPPGPGPRGPSGVGPPYGGGRFGPPRPRMEKRRTRLGMM